MFISQKERIKYYDTLRTIAIISIIAVHSFQTFSPSFEVLHFKAYSFIEFARIGVPIFLMLSGALLLNRDIDIPDFLKKRLARLTYPFIFYLIIMMAVFYIITTHFTGFEHLTYVFTKAPFSTNWYFWLIASLYLAIPILNKFVRHSSMKEIEYFLLVFILGSFFYQICVWIGLSHPIDLTFFINPAGYLILGYYLANKEFNMDTNKIISLMLILFLISTAIKMSCLYGIIPHKLAHFWLNSKYCWGYIDTGLLQIVQSSTIFILFKYLYRSADGIYSKCRHALENNTINNLNVSVSKASYGMYLLHHTLLDPLRIILKGFAFSGSQVCLVILLQIFSLTFVCWIIVILLSKIPIIGKYAGYH